MFACGFLSSACNRCGFSSQVKSSQLYLGRVAQSALGWYQQGPRFSYVRSSFDRALLGFCTSCAPLHSPAFAMRFTTRSPCELSVPLYIHCAVHLRFPCGLSFLLSPNPNLKMNSGPEPKVVRHPSLAEIHPLLIPYLSLTPIPGFSLDTRRSFMSRC